MTSGHAFDGSRNLSAVRLDGWHHPVVLIIINGLRDAPGEVLDGLATAAEPVLRLRVALGATADVGQARLSMFCLAVDWAIERRQRAGRSAAYAALVIDSLDETIDSAQLASELRAASHNLVAALSEDRVGVVLEIERRDRSGATAVALIATVARTRQVLGGISIIGPDRAAAAFGAASGALELARRLGPGNAVVA
jgi:hypothetical protein